MNDKKIGVWLVGALGSISTTVIVGSLLLKKGLVPPTGMVTATESFEGLKLADWDSLVFGGSDLRCGGLRETARRLLGDTGLMSADVLNEIGSQLDLIQADIRMGTARNCGEAIQGLAAESASHPSSVRDEIEEVRRGLKTFRAKHSLDEVIVVNLASTEPPLELGSSHQSLAALEACLDRNESEAIRASTIYAYAAIEERCPYINFTPSNGALIPAVVELAKRNGVPVMGSDGKTGETLVKSSLAPMFLCRNLEVLSWQGFNLLGNMDGSILSHPDNKESKLKTKDQVLSRILGYAPHSKVHIDYVPSLDDQKTAWDFIHFKGFLEVKMSLQFIWQGYDSILAAPLVLDLVRLADLAKRRGESGLMPHLASYFKAPLGVSEHRLYEQFQMLAEYTRRAKEG